MRRLSMWSSFRLERSASGSVEDEAMKQQTANIIRAFLQGMTGAGLFRKLNYPGAPQYAVDPRSVEEIMASGDFDRYCRQSFWNSFIDGFTLEGIVGDLRIPGDPTRMFKPESEDAKSETATLPSEDED